jgi:transposase-like protein
MTKERRIYTPEFKMDAVRLVTEQGYKPTEAAVVQLPGSTPLRL